MQLVPTATNDYHVEFVFRGLGLSVKVSNAAQFANERARVRNCMMA
jgi:hypothetical protein